MNFDEIVRGRRSIRRYKDQPVAPQDIEAILEAGRLAPSAKNEQRWHFTVVKNAGLRGALAQACQGQTMLAEAPVVLVVWADNDRMMRCGQSAATVDCSIALSFMMLKATELGLGTCWLGAFAPEQVRAVLHLPENAVVVAVTPLGYANEAPAARARKPLEEMAEIRE